MVAAVILLGLPIPALAGNGIWTRSTSWFNGSVDDGVSASVAGPDTSGNSLFALSLEGSGVWTTTDFGADWTPQENGPIDPTAVAVAPSDPSVLYEDADASPNPGIFVRSSDSGLTWQQQTQPSPDRFCTASKLEVSPVDPDTVVYLSFICNAIWRSADGGGHWTSVSVPAAQVNDVAIDAASGALYAAAGNGLYRSPSGNGGDWTPFAAFDGCWMFAVQLFAGPPFTIYTTGAWQGPGSCTILQGSGSGIWRSADGGASFDELLDSPQVSWQTLAIDPSQTIILASNNVAQLAASQDGGSHFTISSPSTVGLGPFAIDPLDPENVLAAAFAGSPNRFVQSTDGGRTWFTPPRVDPVSMPATAIAIDPGRPGTIFAAIQGDGAAITRDDGASWLQATGLAPPFWTRSALSIAPDTRASQRVYLGTYQGVWTSGDNGESFQPSVLDHGSIDALAVDPSHPGTAYAGAYDGGLWRTADGGATWTPATGGLADDDVNALAVDPFNTQIVYVATAAHGVWKSVDGGSSWNPTGLSNGFADSLAIDPATPGTLYAGTCLDASTNILRSTDSGATWTTRGVGLPAHCVNAITIDPAAPDLIYAGSGGLGVYASPDAGLDWYPLDNDLDRLGGTVVDSLAMPPGGAELHAGGQGGELDYRFATDVWSSITSGAASVVQGGALTYTATFGNDGPDDATNVVGVLKLPAGLAAPPVSSDLGSCSGGEVDTCRFGILSAGEGLTLTVSLPAPETPGALVAQTSITNDRDDLASLDDTDTATVTVTASLAPNGKPDTVAPNGLSLVGSGKQDSLSAPFQRGRTVTLRWSGLDASGITSFDLRTRTGTASRALGSPTLWLSATTGAQATYTAKPGTTVCFGLRARDAAGNTSDWTSYRCTASHSPPAPSSTAAAGARGDRGSPPIGLAPHFSWEAFAPGASR